jgi:anionic cell wall polymer biosynthesis LytR-Cps2A-Psr (LCP) family protein
VHGHQGRRVPRRAQRDVQLRLLHRRGRLRREDRRVDHRPAHGPLLIDDLGGVEITTTKSIEDPDSHLNLKAGTHTLDGKQALGLVRTRHGVGDGSDLGRIQLQQAFIKALVHQIKDVGVLSNPKRLLDLAETATNTVTTDSDLGSVNKLASFASGLKGISPSNMHMVTMPVAYDPADPNRVLLQKKKADQIWKALENDRPIPKSATEGNATGEAKGVVTGS